jgi:hypothetical protein
MFRVCESCGEWIAEIERIEEMQRFNRWLRENGACTAPPISLLDTTDAEPAETVASVAAWVRERLGPR